MADLPETSTWEPGVYQIENTDPVVGGPPDLGLGQGISNVPPQQLANRTKYLFDQIAALQTSAVDQTDIDAAIATLIGGAPLALDTLNELAAALADDADYAATITTALASKLGITDTAADSAKLGGQLASDVPHMENGSLMTGFGANSGAPAGAAEDWSDPLNTHSGWSKYLLMGDGPNGPGPSAFFYVMNAEYQTRDGTGNVCQMAFPYLETAGATQSAIAANSMHYRTRFQGAWSPWRRVLTDLDDGTIGVGQTWQDVKASRVGNTAYQNTTGRPIMVAVADNNAVHPNFQVSTDNTTWVSVGLIGGNSEHSFSFIVPDGHYYRVNNTITASIWSELR